MDALVLEADETEWQASCRYWKSYKREQEKWFQRRKLKCYERNSKK
jgi:hypothetical protein